MVQWQGGRALFKSDDENEVPVLEVILVVRETDNCVFDLRPWLSLQSNASCLSFCLTLNLARYCTFFIGDMVNGDLTCSFLF